jgi:hypothetical protein
MAEHQRRHQPQDSRPDTNASSTVRYYAWGLISGALLGLLLAGLLVLWWWRPNPPPIVVHPPPAALAAPPSLGQPAILTPPSRLASSPLLDVAVPSGIHLQSQADLLNLLNSGSLAELTSLPGIGEVKANAIISGRPFASVQDLDRIPGIGEGIITQLLGEVNKQQ